MPTPAEVTIALLKSIDASLKVLVAQSRATVTQAVATDEDLDGKYGNPVVKFMPRDWTGEDYKGRHMSELPAPLLDMVAKTYDYFAQRAEDNNEMTNTGKPAGPYKRLDAARARGWAKRVRDGKGQVFQAPVLPPQDTWGGETEAWATVPEDDIAF
jgi:hypothetical protein